MAIIESIPNVSEGRRPDVVERLADGGPRACRACACSTTRPTPTHNRSVFTLAGDAGAGQGGHPRAVRARASPPIDLRTQRGEHPRLGAVDVVPFVPIEGVTMAECVALAQEVGGSGRRAVRRAGLSLRRGVARSGAAQPRGHPPRRIRGARREDGRARLGARLRARRAASDAPAPSVIGARMPLIAYNINLATDRLDVAKKIAAAVRHSSGGLRYVKAMGCRARATAASCRSR